MPALRAEMANLTEAHACLEEEHSIDEPPLRHARFGAPLRAPRPVPTPPLARCAAAEALRAHQNFRQLLQADARRVRASALIHFTRLVRLPAGWPICVALQLPQHVVPLVSDAEAEARARCRSSASPSPMS